MIEEEERRKNLWKRGDKVNSKGEETRSWE